MSVGGGCQGGRDKRSKDKARLMPQKADSHLWVLRTFHIKTSRHSRWVKSWRPITAASSNHIASCSGMTPIVELFFAMVYICFLMILHLTKSFRAINYVFLKQSAKIWGESGHIFLGELIKYQNTSIFAGFPESCSNTRISLPSTKSWHFACE